MTTTSTAHSPGERATLITQELKSVAELAPVRRRVIKPGEVLFMAGQPMDCLHLVSVGVFKSKSVSVDGREMVVGFHSRGSWLGFDGVADGRYPCEMEALDTSEVMSIPYNTLLEACSAHPALMKSIHQSMSRDQSRGREAMIALCTLDAASRVAGFLVNWAESMAEHGLRNDQITLRLTRAEIGSYLGLTLESVSRAFSRLASQQLIGFEERGRRAINIPRVDALASFVRQRAATAAALH